MKPREIIETANEISLNKKYTDYICELIGKDLNLITQLENIEDAIKEKLFKNTKSYNDFIKVHFPQDLHMTLNLYFALVFARECKGRYISKDIDHDIYKDTLNDISIWADTYHMQTGKIGLKEIHWIRKHIFFKIFKLGRLQFEMTDLEKDVKSFTKNSECLNIHIPEGEPLEPLKCQQSLKVAKSFFIKHFNKNYQVAVCHSWLLHENLKVILDQNANIVKFAQLFEIVENTNDCSQALERVFGTGTKISANMPERTSLQRKMKRFLLDGNVVGMGYGIINLS